MRRYHQLELLAPPPDPQPDRWLYAMYARYQDRTNALIYIEAESEDQARAIATKQLQTPSASSVFIRCLTRCPIVSKSRFFPQRLQHLWRKGILSQSQRF
jgi:hypothetical protein